MFYNETLDAIPLNDYKKVYNSCTINIINISIICCIFIIT